jgi:ribosomal protein L23
VSRDNHPRDILLRPVVSEKSYGLLDEGKYTFVVAPGANKTQIRLAVEAVFGVKVTGVNTLNRPGKRRRTRVRDARITVAGGLQQGRERIRGNPVVIDDQYARHRALPLPRGSGPTRAHGSLLHAGRRAAFIFPRRQLRLARCLSIATFTRTRSHGL